MCGRYTLSNKKEVKKKFNKKINTNFNITPFTKVLIINEELKPCFIQWCYNPLWAKNSMNLINARSETLRQKPSFKNVLPCIFITDGWYEWQQKQNIKIPYYFQKNSDLIYFAGIYNKTSGCAIITKKAHQKISFIHHRQPVLLEEKDFSKWIEGQDIYDSTSTGCINFYPVSKDVNNPKNNSLKNIKQV